MDVTITLKGKHSGEPIEIEARDCSVHEERQTWDYPGSLDVEWEELVLITDDERDGLPLDEEIAKLYDDFIVQEVYEAYRDQEPY